jgi:3-oxoacyl-(acyl-carrier-protein) synthase
MIGHLLGAAGALSAVATVKTLVSSCLPPTINQFTSDPDCDLDYVAWKPRQAQVNNVLVNGFGFGGQNSVAVFKRWSE